MVASLATSQMLVDTQAQAGYAITGAVNTVIFRLDKTVAVKHGCTFAVKVFGAWWDITVFYPDGSRRAVFSDGTNVLNEFFDPKAPKTWPIPATIQHEAFPALGYYPDIIWLAYASGYSLPKLSQLPALWLDPRNVPDAHVYDIVVSGGDFKPYLPIEVNFITSKNRILSAARNPLLDLESVSDKARRQRKQRVARIQEGYEAAAFHSAEVTNIGLFTLPVRFTFETYYPPNAGMRSNETKRATSAPFLQVGTRMVGTSKQVSLFTNGLAWPSLLGVASVADRRFISRRQGIDCIVYNTTNAWIIDTNNARLQRLWQEKRREAPFVRPDILHDLWNPIIFGLLLVGPPIMWWVIRGRRAKQQA